MGVEVRLVDGDGKTIFSFGESDAGVFPRSACKAMQALPLIESGAADAYGFGNVELALHVLKDFWGHASPMTPGTATRRVRRAT